MQQNSSRRRSPAWSIAAAPHFFCPFQRQDLESITEQTFDANAYLAANPDVAQNWRGSAFEHFIMHGRAEGRSLRPGETEAEVPLDHHYQLTAGVAALAAGVPTVNGISGKFPPDWDLMRVFGRNVGERVDRWLQQASFPGDCHVGLNVFFTLRSCATHRLRCKARTD
jgi:hypothetical protein